MSTYNNVKFGKSEGSLVLSSKDITFQTSEKALKMSWASIAKHQITPKSHAKALLKLMMQNNKPTKLFEMATRQELENINSEIISHTKGLSASGGSKATSGGAASVASAAALYQSVTYRSMVGALHLSDSQLRFEANDDPKKAVSLSLNTVSKQKMSPPKVAKFMLKLTKQDDKVITFQVNSRQELETLNADIEKRRKQTKKSGAPAVNNSKSTRIETEGGGSQYSNVLFKSASGTLSISTDQMEFQSTGPKSVSKVIRFSRVSKCQMNPPSHAKVLLKVMLTDDAPLLFQLTDRTVLQQLKDDIAAKLKAKAESKRKTKASNNKLGLGDQLSALKGSKGKEDEDARTTVTVETKFTVASNRISTSVPIVYKGVKHGNDMGTLALSKQDISFQKEGSTSATARYPWGDIFKHQCSPPKIPKALMKLVLTNSEKPVTFQLANRKDLDKIKRDIAIRLQEFQDQAADAENKLESIAESSAHERRGSAANKNGKASTPTKATKLDKAEAAAKPDPESDISPSKRFSGNEKKEKVNGATEEASKFAAKASLDPTISDLLAVASIGSSGSDASGFLPQNDTISGLLARSNEPPREVIKTTKLPSSTTSDSGGGGGISSIFDDSFGSLTSDAVSFMDDNSDDDFSVVTHQSVAGQEPEKVTALPQDYTGVTFRSMTGVATLSKEHLLFQPDESLHPGESSTKIAWDSVERHHGSPPKKSKAMLKIFMKNGKSTTFTMANRKDLELIRMDMTSRLHEYRKTSFTSKALEGLVIGKGKHSSDRANGYVPSYKKMPTGAKAPSAYHPVHFQQAEGSLFLSWDQFSFQPSGLGDVDNAKTICWESVASNEASQDKPILTFKLSDGTSLSFKLSNRKELDKCEKDAATRMSAYDEFEKSGTYGSDPTTNKEKPLSPKSRKQKLAASKSDEDEYEVFKAGPSLLDLSDENSLEDDFDSGFFGTPPPPPARDRSNSDGSSQSGSSSSSNSSSSSSSSNTSLDSGTEASGTEVSGTEEGDETESPEDETEATGD